MLTSIKACKHLQGANGVTDILLFERHLGKISCTRLMNPQEMPEAILQNVFKAAMLREKHFRDYPHSPPATDLHYIDDTYVVLFSPFSPGDDLCVAALASRIPENIPCIRRRLTIFSKALGKQAPANRKTGPKRWSQFAAGSAFDESNYLVLAPTSATNAIKTGS